ncbi:MAG: biotin--[acetyl-CoA-carboxylase] ligase [Fibrobacter sp.]|jgi:BirA family biotin operon repressor/biotin-[acetyl-CoA-carboxylase] ligase|nr:biotin--[acetyl-CoA-carboxylase] ligase [Fibrobacter sp.]
MSPEILSPERPFSLWNIHGLFGSGAVLLSETNSTHAYMKEHIRELPPGTVVVADTQNQGRGRHERTWISPRGKNLYFNTLIPLDSIPQKNYSGFTQITALTLASVLEESGVKTSVKWPNDLLWNEHKICGILSELFFMNHRPLLSMGIGLNVNSEAPDYQDLDRKAASLSMILSKKLNREVLLNQILRKIEHSLREFAENGFTPWLEAWKKMENFAGREARVIRGETVLTGTIAGINDDGSLQFKTPDEKIISVYSGDLEI